MDVQFGVRESSFLSSFLANASCLSCFLISRVFGLFIGNVLLSRIQRLLLVSYRGFDLRPLLAAFGLFISLSPLRVPSFLGLFPSPSWCPWSQTSPLTFLCQSFLENRPPLSEPAGCAVLSPTSQASVAFLLLWRERGVPVLLSNRSSWERPLRCFRQIRVAFGHF